MTEEAAPTLTPVPGIDFAEYRDTGLQRFSNAAIADTVARLAADTSDRIPKFIFPFVRERLERDEPVPLSAAITAAWARYSRGFSDSGAPSRSSTRSMRNCPRRPLRVTRWTSSASHPFSTTSPKRRRSPAHTSRHTSRSRRSARCRPSNFSPKDVSRRQTRRGGTALGPSRLCVKRSRFVSRGSVRVFGGSAVRLRALQTHLCAAGHLDRAHARAGWLSRRDRQRAAQSCDGDPCGRQMRDGWLRSCGAGFAAR